MADLNPETSIGINKGSHHLGVYSALVDDLLRVGGD